MDNQYGASHAVNADDDDYDAQWQEQEYAPDKLVDS